MVPLLNLLISGAALAACVFILLPEQDCVKARDATIPLRCIALEHFLFDLFNVAIFL